MNALFEDDLDGGLEQGATDVEAVGRSEGEQQSPDQEALELLRSIRDQLVQLNQVEKTEAEVPQDKAPEDEAPTEEGQPEGNFDNQRPSAHESADYCPRCGRQCNQGRCAPCAEKLKQLRIKKSATNSFMKLAGPGAKVARESVDEVTELGLEEVSMRPLRGNRAFADIQKARSMRFKAKQDKEALDAKNKPKKDQEREDNPVAECGTPKQGQSPKMVSRPTRGGGYAFFKKAKANQAKLAAAKTVDVTKK